MAYYAALSVLLISLLISPPSGVLGVPVLDPANQKGASANSDTTHNAAAPSAGVAPDKSLLETGGKAAAEAEVETGARAAAEAHEIFCTCRHDDAPGSGLQELCPGISTQCRATFCKPLCLRMAWIPRIEVHCDRAPGWNWCPKFAAQVCVL